MMSLASFAQRLCHWWRAPSDLGSRGEAAAARYLRRKRFRLIGRKIRSAGVEIDLVAADGPTIVFVEVKTRATHHAGHPAEAIDAFKQRRLSRGAAAYVKRHRLAGHPVRFDVVAVTWPDGRARPAIEHYSNAFPALDD
jgi:putative endonuclease